MSKQTNLEMELGNASQSGNSWTDDSLVQKDLLGFNKAYTDKQNDSFLKLTSEGTTDESQDIILKNHCQNQNNVPNENGNDRDTSVDHTINKDTVSDDHQTERGVITEDHLHEYDTVSHNISVGVNHVTDEGDIALRELLFCIRKSKPKNKATTLPQKFTKDKTRDQHIDPTLPAEPNNVDTMYERGAKPSHPYIQIVRNGGGRSSDIIGGCRIKESAGATAQVQELKHGNVTAEYEKQASLSRRSEYEKQASLSRRSEYEKQASLSRRSEYEKQAFLSRRFVKESRDRHHPANTSAVSHHNRIHDLDKYDFSFPHRGYAVLIVNKRFTNFSTRDGAQFDVTKSKDILQKLGYCQMNNECKNLDKESTLKILKAARDTDHSMFDSFALIVSSHGDEKENQRKNGKKEHAIYCTDDQYIFTGDILEMFSDDNCPSLRGKPKLFFIQACRGSKTDLGAEIAVIEANNGNTSKEEQITWTQSSVGHKDSFSSNYDGKNPEGETKEHDPHIAPVESVDDTDAGRFLNIWDDRPIVHCINDCLVMYAIPSGHFAWRSNTDGSWMLHYLWGEVMSYDYRKPCSFLKVLTTTNRKMANRETHTPGNPGKSGKKAIPSIIHQLDKDIVFRQKKYSEYSTITFV
ncbi:hypothetical protein ACJMK2_033282 [Sinanodonta woodiana]|uniref:Uncharacterized protein n=1 Tax=Sinanodonta woodiana TaxID=1069815 RepID=A0ABD3WRC7_SINWO